jgi:hypothetical protein
MVESPPIDSVLKNMVLLPLLLLLLMLGDGAGTLAEEVAGPF